ncbi:MAG: hypothetical protein ACE5HS_14460 [bacterium]
MGSVHRLNTADLADQVVACSPHFTGLPSVIQFGRARGYQMPEQVQIFAVEALDPYTFSPNLSTELQAAEPGIVQEVIRYLNALLLSPE